jgi:hypothetical protein
MAACCRALNCTYWCPILIVMRAAYAIAIVPAAWLLGVVIVLGTLALNNPSPSLVAIFGLAMCALVPTGFELCRFAVSSEENEHHFFSGGYRTYIFDIVIMLLAICLTVGTVTFHHSSRLFCDGRLSAGFPVAFICDASGESPLSSVGKIDGADVDSINLLGSFVDVLFYLSLLSVARLAVSRLSVPTRRLFG